jgi:D-sedoheptulose 7-phosphate isomerase
MDSIDRYLDDTYEMVRALPRDDIRRVVEAVRSVRESGRRIFVMGNGGSAATASHMACDLAKASIEKGGKRIMVMALTDNTALMTALANDSTYEDMFAGQLLNLVQPGDLVIAISGSGNSPNVLKAVEAAKLAGATTVGFTGEPGGRLREMADIVVMVPSGRIEQAEDGHLILEHAIAVALRDGVA